MDSFFEVNISVNQLRKEVNALVAVVASLRERVTALEAKAPPNKPPPADDTAKAFQ